MEGVLRMLPRRILEAQEAERTKVAHELHDDVCQRLTATKLHLEAFESSIPGRALNLHKKLRAIKHQVNMNIQEVRRISANLRPSTLDDMGLVAALQLLCKEFQTVYHVDVSFDAKNVRAERFEAPVEIALYRIAQESFSNIGKHAHAKGASVRLWTGDERVQLTIEDNGRGFEADSMYTHGAPGYKLGLINMKERAELLRGTCFIHSEVNRGTTIRVEIPLNSNGEYEKN
jgi:signal transduction histidine kinase